MKDVIKRKSSLLNADQEGYINYLNQRAALMSKTTESSMLKTEVANLRKELDELKQLIMNKYRIDS